jgi:hypothetical protein
MKVKYIQILGLAASAVYLAAIVFIYTTEPRSLAEIPSKAASAIENAASRGQVIIGTYEIDKTEFARGLADFRSDNFIAAREDFRRADPQNRDAATQFYIAYSFYRQGWGRLSNDDDLFRQGLEQLAVVDNLDTKFRSQDEDLKLKTTGELRHEFEEGLKVTAGDFNPLKLVRERY